VDYLGRGFLKRCIPADKMTLVMRWMRRVLKLLARLEHPSSDPEEQPSENPALTKPPRQAGALRARCGRAPVRNAHQVRVRRARARSAARDGRIRFLAWARALGSKASVRAKIYRGALFSLVSMVGCTLPGSNAVTITPKAKNYCEAKVDLFRQGECYAMWHAVCPNTTPLTCDEGLLLKAVDTVAQCREQKDRDACMQLWQTTCDYSFEIKKWRAEHHVEFFGPAVECTEAALLYSDAEMLCGLDNKQACRLLREGPWPQSKEWDPKSLTAGAETARLHAVDGFNLHDELVIHRSTVDQVRACKAGEAQTCADLRQIW